MKKLMMLAALAVLCVVEAFAAADQVRDGESFNTPNCQRKFVRRTVDSTGTVAGRMDSAVVICAPNVMPTPMTVGGVYDGDTTSRALRMNAGGKVYVVDGDRDRDYGQVLSTGITALSLATGATGISSLVDLRTYKHAVLKLSWDAADSANVALGVKVYNKQSSSWAADDTPILLPIRQQGTSPAAAADTTGALAFVINGQLARPTYYVFRNATAPVAGTYTLTALSRTPLIVPGASGVAIYLTPDCGPFAWFGLQITNANGNTVDQIKATLWVSR